MSEIHSIEELLPHVVQRVWCSECGAHFIDVRPEITDLSICECTCGRIGSIQPELVQNRWGDR